MSKKSVSRSRGLTATFGILLAFSVAASTIAYTYRKQLDSFLGTKSETVVTETSGDEDLYPYKSDYSTTKELVDGIVDLGVCVSEEGSALLKNDGNALPLGESERNVTVFGAVGYNPFLGGQIGSSASDNSAYEGYENVTLLAALEEAGFAVNPTVREAYESSGVTPGRLSMTFAPAEAEKLYTISEASLPDIGVTESSVEGYTDAAIVVIGRPATESMDYFPDQVAESDGSTVAKTPLSLSKLEKDMIKFAKKTCDKVVVLVNTTSTMELEDLKNDTGVDSILWIGYPGSYGMTGVANLLAGTANPSGHLADTYAVDYTSSPAMANYGLFMWENRADITRKSEVTGADLTYTDLRAVAYEVEAESIYTGYYYYETRYYDKVTGAANVGEYEYTDQVTYPFGYGLSYTTFEQTIDSLTWDKSGKTVTAEVTVKNTGSEPGKGVAQLYVSTPYGDYEKENLVEKSAIQLIGYEKTQELQPGAEETFTITVDSKYFASYDANGAKTYIMSEGDYFFAIGDSAHDALNNVLAYQGYSVADGMDAAGDVEKVVKDTVDALDTTTYATSDSGAEITNRLDDADLNYWMPDTVTYLSRQDWTGTWPKSYTGLSATADMIKHLANRTYEIKTDDDTSAFRFGVDNGDQTITFAMMKGVPYEDDRWDYFIDQFTLDEMLGFIVNSERANETVANPKWTETDGPNGINSVGIGNSTLDDEDNPYKVTDDDPYKDFRCGTMAAAPVVAGTFSHEVAEAWGALLGNESLWVGAPYIWAPGLNMHRTPYCGRNHEYYSEDPMLVNYVGADVVGTALEYGFLVSPKHFAFNDMELNRYGLAPFMTEQKARELELRAFEGALSDAGGRGVMTAFNRIGCTFVNAHVGVMQGILRGEWGFNGVNVTDMVNGPEYFTPLETILGGGVLLASSNWGAGGPWTYVTADTVKNDATILAAVRDIMHQFYYALANSNATQGLNGSSRLVQLTTWWSGTLLGCEIAFGVLTGVSACAYIFFSIKNRKSAEVN